MKILFICGSLEYGHDGVGDYTRKLSGQLIEKGHQAQIIAINDKFVREPKLQIQRVANSETSTLRLPEFMSWEEKLIQARQFVDSFDPDWLSLQFVPFAFHNKGLPLRLGERLKLLSKGRKWHIMFHELCVGLDKESLLKIKLWGWVQKKIILRIVNSLNPEVISTQTFLYQSILAEEGVTATMLPLFSNIRRTQLKVVKDESSFICILFGGIHAGAPVEDFVKELKEYCDKIERKLIFSFVGRNGGSVNEWISVLEREGIDYVNNGECDEEMISMLLLKSDLGVSTTPYLLSQKSGTVAAMLEHNLKVVSVARAWTPVLNVGLPAIPYVFNYTQGNLNKTLQCLKESSDRKKTVVSLFLNYLQ